MAFVACAARVHVAPVCEMLETVFCALFLVVITAMSVLPSVGADPNVTTQVVAPLVPVCPVALCTLAGNAGAVIVLTPTSSNDNEPEPVKVKFTPSTLFEMVKSLANAMSVPLYGRVPVNVIGLGVMFAVRLIALNV